MSRLRLVALDEEDLKVVSGFCQDSVLTVGEMSFSPHDNRFVMEINRFDWEEAHASAGNRIRRKSVLHFERVNSVKLSGIDRADPGLVLSLLAIQYEESSAPAGLIDLIFAGDGAIRLDVECIEAQLADMPAAWQAKSTPAHE